MYCTRIEIAKNEGVGSPIATYALICMCARGLEYVCAYTHLDEILKAGIKSHRGLHGQTATASTQTADKARLKPESAASKRRLVRQLPTAASCEPKPRV